MQTLPVWCVSRVTSYRQLVIISLKKNHWWFVSNFECNNAVLWLNGDIFLIFLSGLSSYILPKWKKSWILWKLRALSQLWSLNIPLRRISWFIGKVITILKILLKIQFHNSSPAFLFSIPKCHQSIMTIVLKGHRCLFRIFYTNILKKVRTRPSLRPRLLLANDPRSS